MEPDDSMVAARLLSWCLLAARAANELLIRGGSLMPSCGTCRIEKALRVESCELRQQSEVAVGQSDCVLSVGLWANRFARCPHYERYTSPADT